MVLRAVNLQPNDPQTAIAAYAILSLQKEPSQIWDLLGGMGKSRVIATMALMCLLSLGFEKVHIVLPAQSLMKLAQAEFNDYWVKSNTVGRVIYHNNFDFEICEGEMIISDEADQLMFLNPNKFFDKASTYPIISVTASMPVTDTKSLEQRVIEEMKLKSLYFTGNETVQEHDFDEELIRANDEQLA